MAPYRRRQPLQPPTKSFRLGGTWLTSLQSIINSGLASGVEKRHSWPGAATSCNSGSRRLEGPIASPQTGSGTESTGGIYDLTGRLERLAFPPTPTPGAERPPMETYTVTPTEHGDVVRATDDYVRWFRSRYPKAGREDRASRPGASGAPQKVGGAKRAKWMT